MRIYISFDLEGVAGVVDWSQCSASGGSLYATACALALGEVSAAVNGAIEGGATEVVVNDAHGSMFNLDPRLLPAGTTYISGSFKPMYMMEGLDGTFAGIFFIGYHGAMSSQSSVLSHSYSPDAFAAVSLNGVEVGETGINSLLASHYGVPIALVTGDDVTVAEASLAAPAAVAVVTKRAISRFAAAHAHPSEVTTRIRAAAREAVREVSRGSITPAQISTPATLELQLRTSDQADVAMSVVGAERIAARSISLHAPNLFQLYSAFLAVGRLARTVGTR